MLKWERLNADDEIDVTDDMTRLTLDTIGLCGFDYRFNSFYRDGNHPFVDAMLRALRNHHADARPAAGRHHPSARAAPAARRYPLHARHGRGA